jgi:MshEN domain
MVSMSNGLSAAGLSAESEQGDSVPAEARPSLMSLLVEAEIATEEQLRLAAAEGMGTGERLGQLVLRRGWVTEQGLARLLARQWGLVFLDEEVLELAVIERELLPVAQARRLAGCLVGLTEGQRFVVLADPSSERLRELGELVGAEATFAVVTESSLQRLLDRLTAASERALRSESETRETAEVLVAEDGQADGLIAEVEAARAVLAALAGRVEQLTADRRATEDELVRLREELARVKQEREQERALAGARAVELEREHARSAAIRQKLNELLRETDDQ